VEEGPVAVRGRLGARQIRQAGAIPGILKALGSG
jgi:hypothetical protein